MRNLPVRSRRLCCAVGGQECGSAQADAPGRIQADEGGGALRYPDGSVDEEDGDEGED